MRAIGRKHQIVRPQRIADTHGNRFLTDRKMDRALDAIGGVKLDNALFDQANQERSPEKPPIDLIMIRHAMSLPARSVRPMS